MIMVGRQRLSARHRLRAHRARSPTRSARCCRGRHGAHRRPGRGGRASEPGAALPTSSPPPRTRRCAGRAAAWSCAASSTPRISIERVFPGMQGGPLMHVIAAKAVCFGEALQPEFTDVPAAGRRQRQGAGRGACRRPASASSRGGTDNHLMLVDVFSRGLTGKVAEEALDKRRHHRQQEHDSVRHEPADGRQRHPHRHAGGHHPRHARTAKWTSSPSSSRARCRRPTTTRRWQP